MSIESKTKPVLNLLSRASWFPVLLARMSVGWVFVQSGWGKLHNLPKVIEYFQSLGIPAPEFQARLVSLTDLGGGVCLLLGLLARLVSLPLTCTMIVALLTAKRADIGSAADLFGMEEFLFILVFLWVLFEGPGRASLDALITRTMRRK